MLSRKYQISEEFRPIAEESDPFLKSVFCPVLFECFFVFDESMDKMDESFQKAPLI